MATRWGICSAGRIANDFVGALKLLPPTDHQVVAVATGNDVAKAQAFAEKFDIPQAYGSYEELAKDPNVEVVYVSNIDKLHYSSCDLFLDHGKHVLCEKPVTETREQCQRLVDKARDKKLFFMEGMWTRCFPGYQTICEVLKSGQLGRVNCLMGAFCVRGYRAKEPTDVLKDLGCYLVQYAWLAYPELPDRVIAVKKSGRGVSMLLDYKNGGMAAFYITVRGERGANNLTFYGTKGNLQIHEDMHCPTKITLPDGQTKTFPMPETSFQFNYPGGEGFTYEAECVRNCLKKGLIECPEMTHEDSLNVMSILEEAKRQIGH